MSERIDDTVLWWLGHVERMEKFRIAKRVYVVECASSRSAGRQRKRWIDASKEGFKKCKDNIKIIVKFFFF